MLEQSLRTILDSIEEPQLLVRADYTIAYANQAFRRRFGLNDHVGRRCHEVIFHELRPCSECGFACPLDHALVSGRAETHLRRELIPGGERFLEITVTPVPDADGSTAFFMERVLVRGGELGVRAGIVARSPAAREVLKKLARVTALDVPVLFVGDVGSGKERFAKTLHENSRRAANAFIVVSCEGLTEEAFENECLGRTDISGHRQGGLAAQPGGTIYFDEVALLPKALQRQLLMLIESGMVRARWASEARAVDYRIICSTRYDLAEFVRQGKFRRDLFYLLYACRIDVPGLNERVEDVEEIAQEILRAGAVPAKTISPEGLRYLQMRHWSGNVRELETLLARTAIFCDSDRIDRADLEKFDAELLTQKKNVSECGADLLPKSFADTPKTRKRLTANQVKAIQKEAPEWLGTKRSLAERYGISERTLYRLLKLERTHEK